MKKLTVGIDVSKDKLDFCTIDNEDHSVVNRGVLDNKEGSILKWLESLRQFEVVFCMEHTGYYGALLAWLLSEHGLCFYMINPLELKRSIGIQRGKTDIIDAYRIASFTVSHKHCLKTYKLPAEALRKLKALMTARERYVKIAVQLKNSLKGSEILNNTLDVRNLIREEKKQIKSMERSIVVVEKQMAELISLSEELKQTYTKVTNVIGVGPITAIKCIVETDNFLKFPNARKFSCHCGLAPFPYQSGSSIKGRNKTHFLRNKSLKATLFKAAGSAIQHDPQLKQYYQRKIKEGKHKLSALNAVANKLVLRIFAVAKREEPFVKLNT